MINVDMKKHSGIYEIKCYADNKTIVGSSINLYLRSKQHISDLKRNIHKNPHLQSAWNKYGESNFEFIVLEECLPEELLKKEDEWIKIRNSLNRNFGFNLKEAERPLHNEETCKKISEGKMGSKNPMYGKKHSEEHRRKIGEASRIQMTGRHPSIETRLKMSKSQTGKKLSEETKRKIGAASKIRVFSEESRKRMSEHQIGEKSPMWGKKQSEETKEKRRRTMAETMRLKKIKQNEILGAKEVEDIEDK